mmetsp:Transcript_31025/g.78607  ORF Transcript_31025/g.78607 Transcript_31025/m.78607 type:complete len:428 (-) Transcript_31025:1512-2795(-)
MNIQSANLSFSFFFSERFSKKKNTFFSKKNLIKFKKNKIKLSLKENSDNDSKLRLHQIADKLNHLLSLEKFSESTIPEEYKGQLESTMHIAVIFSKILVQDQITVEFERRVSTILTQIKYRKFKPDIMAFIGGYGNQNHLSGATAGYIYFRHISQQANVDIEGLEFIIEETTHSTHENLICLLNTLKKKYGEEAVSKCHFSLISSDYHLIRIAEIYKLSQRQSLLTSLYNVGATWTYLFAAYPFCVSPDPTLAFLGRIRVLANDLSIVLVNLNGLVEFSDFIAKENFSRLCETNKKLRIMLRIMSEPSGNVNSSRGSVEIPFHQWEILESSLCVIHEVQVILTPLVNGKSVERRTLIRARDLLMNVVKNIRLAIDPDRPLCHEEWKNSFCTEKNSKKNLLFKKKHLNPKKSVQKRLSPFCKKMEWCI